MAVKVNENDYTCDTCKHKKSCPQAWSFDQQDLEDIDQATCGDYEEEVEQTEDEKRENAGCDECHRIMVEGREIL